MSCNAHNVPANYQHPDKNRRQPRLSESQSTAKPWQGRRAFRLCLSTTASPQICEWQFWLCRKYCLRLYLILWSVPSEDTQWPEQACQVMTPKGAPDPVKHQGACSQEGNYRWIGYHLAKSQLNKRLKTPSPSTGPDGRVSLPSVPQSENSPSNTPLPDTCQWHLITSVSPSASLLLHLDWLPSHCWLCWTNLESPWTYAASPMGTWHMKTSLTIYLLWLIAHTWATLRRSLNDGNWLLCGQSLMR